jgi:hypothetical protein
MASTAAKIIYQSPLDMVPVSGKGDKKPVFVIREDEPHQVPALEHVKYLDDKFLEMVARAGGSLKWVLNGEFVIITKREVDSGEAKKFVPHYYHIIDGKSLHPFYPHFPDINIKETGYPIHANFLQRQMDELRAGKIGSISLHGSQTIEKTIGNNLLLKDSSGVVLLVTEEPLPNTSPVEKETKEKSKELFQSHYFFKNEGKPQVFIPHIKDEMSISIQKDMDKIITGQGNEVKYGSEGVQFTISRGDGCTLLLVINNNTPDKLPAIKILYPTFLLL